MHSILRFTLVFGLTTSTILRTYADNVEELISEKEIIREAYLQLCTATYADDGVMLQNIHPSLNLDHPICIFPDNIGHSKNTPSNPENPLCWAAENNRIQAGHGLLLNGANPDVICSNKKTPMQNLLSRKTPNSLSYIALLLSYTALPPTEKELLLLTTNTPKNAFLREILALIELKTALTFHQYNKLCNAAKTQKLPGLFLYILASYGKDGLKCFKLPDKRVVLDFNEPPLHIAAAYGLDWLLRSLLNDAQNDPNENTEDNLPPLFFAALAGHVPSIYTLLMNGAAIYSLTPEGSSPLSAAYVHNHGPAFDVLLTHMVYTSEKALLDAANALLAHAPQRPQGSTFHLTAPRNVTAPLFKYNPMEEDAYPNRLLK